MMPRLAASLFKTPPAWARRAVLCLAVTATLGGCGGGDQVEKFVPNKIVSFGDENSALVTVNVESSPGVSAGTIAGMKYTVNDLRILKGYDWPISSERDPVLSIVPVLPALPSPAGKPVPKWLYDTATMLATNYPVAPESQVGLSVVRDQRSVERRFDLDFRYCPNPSWLGGTAAAPTCLSSVGVNEEVPHNATAEVKFQYEYDCLGNRLWTQIMASGYGLGFKSTAGSNCPGDREGAVSHAVAGAKVSDVATQVAANRASLNNKTLVTVLAGQNDILAEYEAIVRLSSTDEASAKARLLAKGRELGAVVNDITNTGARVLIVTVPDLGGSPRARIDGKTTLLSELTKTFNNGLTLQGGVKNDGTKIGLVAAYEEVRRMYTNPASYGLTNASSRACTSTKKPNGDDVAEISADSLLYCNSVSTGGKDVTYLWADDVYLTPAGHARIGLLASRRADENPF